MEKEGIISMSNELEELEIDSKNQASRATQIPENIGGGEEDIIRFDTNFRRLSDLIGIKSEDMYDLKDKLKTVINWSRLKSGSNNITDVVFEVKKLRDAIGFRDLGKTALNRIYQYIRLSSEESTLSNRMKLVKKEKEMLKDVTKSSRKHTTVD